MSSNFLRQPQVKSKSSPISKAFSSNKCVISLKSLILFSDIIKETHDGIILEKSSKYSFDFERKIDFTCHENYIRILNGVDSGNCISQTETTAKVPQTNEQIEEENSEHNDFNLNFSDYKPSKNINTSIKKHFSKIRLVNKNLFENLNKN